MSSTFIPISSQPLQSPFHLELHIFRREGITCQSKAPDGLGRHLHDDRVIGGEEVPKVIGKPADAGGIASLNADKARWGEGEQE